MTFAIVSLALSVIALGVSVAVLASNIRRNYRNGLDWRFRPLPGEKARIARSRPWVW